MHKLSDDLINFVINNTTLPLICLFVTSNKIYNKKIIKMVKKTYMGRTKLTTLDKSQIYIILDSNNITYKRVTGNNK